MISGLRGRTRQAALCIGTAALPHRPRVGGFMIGSDTSPAAHQQSTRDFVQANDNAMHFGRELRLESNPRLGLLMH